jgi:outer membrane biogenesis lipoprotein LolB
MIKYLLLIVHVLVILMLIGGCSTGPSKPCNYHSDTEPNLIRREQLQNLEDLCRYDLETRRR